MYFQKNKIISYWFI